VSLIGGETAHKAEPCNGANLRDDATMEKRQRHAKGQSSTGGALARTTGNAADARSEIVWNEETVAALVEYAETLRTAFETLKERGYRIVDGILVSPDMEV
jgi:hypothetical protein